MGEIRFKHQTQKLMNNKIMSSVNFVNILPFPEVSFLRYKFYANFEKRMNLMNILKPSHMLSKNITTSLESSIIKTCSIKFLLLEKTSTSLYRIFNCMMKKNKQKTWLQHIFEAQG